MKFIVRIIIGVVFLASAISKFLSIDQFELYTYSLNIFSLNTSMIFSRLLISLEAILGIFFIFNFNAKLTWRITITLVSLFSIFLIVLIIKGSKENCHCFGEVIDLNPIHSLLKNILFIVLLFLIKPKRIITHRTPGFLSVIIILAGLATPMILSPPDFMMYKAHDTAGQQFSLNGLTEPTIEILSLNEPDIFKGKVALCFFSTKCRYCKMAARKMSILSNKFQIQENVIYIFMGNPEELKDFYHDSRSDKFPDLIIRPKDFLQITHNEMPKIFLLEDGIIKHLFSYRDISEKDVKDFFTGKD